MAIKLTLEKTQKSLFCESKWWGDPDMPADASYPMMKVCEMPDGSSFLVRPGDDVSGGEVYDYPLTFICQIRCEDIAELDPENRLLMRECCIFSLLWMSTRVMIRRFIWAWVSGQRVLYQ